MRRKGDANLFLSLITKNSSTATRPASTSSDSETKASKTRTIFPIPTFSPRRSSSSTRFAQDETWKPPSRLVELGVADTGVGRPKDRLDLIFDKFYQVDSSETRLYGCGAGALHCQEVHRAAWRKSRSRESGRHGLDVRGDESHAKPSRPRLSRPLILNSVFGRLPFSLEPDTGGHWPNSGHVRQV